MSTYGDEFSSKVVQASGAVKCKALGVGNKKAAPHEPIQVFSVGASVPDATYLVPNAAATAPTEAEYNALAACVHGLVLELRKTGVIAS